MSRFLPLAFFESIKIFSVEFTSTTLFFPSVNPLFILSALCFQVALDETLNTKNLKEELPKLILFGSDTPTKCRRLGQ